ncbi:MAG TPA: 50S ribosomal protein L11 methyltransferase [Dongiaceae bacterium]|nr:50S ribosomal protein L11 methyltransferase [Dongiaceae bacterium]
MTVSKSIPFILDGVQIEPRRPPQLPEIELLLMADHYPDQSLAATDYHRLMAQPPYWAFCWGGGQALARWILDQPQQVAGRAVVDFGAGSGVAGIAAGLAGATEVIAVDIDPDALRLCTLNGVANGVSLKTATSFNGLRHALLLAADICYEEAGWAGVLAHIEAGGDAIVAESRLRNLHHRHSALQLVAAYQMRTFPDLEESENFDEVRIFSTIRT